MATPNSISSAKTFEGEGLANFFKKKAQLAAQANARVAATNGAALTLELDKLDENPFQPRGTMDKGALEELAASIARHGLLQAITVRRTGDRFQVIAGHRRLAAFRLLRDRASEAEKTKYLAVPAQEKVDVTDEQMALYALVENLQRDDLDPVAAASGLAKYQEAEHLTADELAERTGLELRRVHRLLQLDSAPAVVKQGVTRGLKVAVLDADGKPAVTPTGKERFELRKLDLIAALEISRVARHWERGEAEEKAGKRTEALIQKALRDGWTLRRIQEHCQSLLKGRSSSPSESVAIPPAPVYRDDGKQVVIYRSRLAQAPEEDRARLRAVLQALLAELA